jgi:hypothetical protein
MLKKIILTAALLSIVFSLPVFAQKTVVNDTRASAMLLGRHRLSLQWISWDYFGTAIVTNRRGSFYLKGEQKQRRGTDFVRVDGKITEINAKNFKFDGTIIMQVSSINNGEPCKREGEMTFRINGNRRYWRLAEMTNPCDAVTDYVDIFFR